MPNLGKGELYTIPKLNKSKNHEENCKFEFDNETQYICLNQ